MPTATVPAPPPAAPAAAPPEGAWRDGLPDDLKSHAGLAKFKDPISLARSYLTAEAMIGADKVVVPGRDATPEQRREFFTKLGAPATPDGYQLPTDMPAGFEVDPEEIAAYHAKAHEIGLTAAQNAAVLRFYADRETQTVAQLEADLVKEREATVAGLRKEWGAAYDQQMQLAQVTADLGGKEMRQRLDVLGWGNEPLLVKLFAKVGKYLATDKLVAGGLPPSFAMTPADAQQAIASKERDPAFRKAVMTADDPGHKQAQTELENLYKIAYPPPEPLR